MRKALMPKVTASFLWYDFWVGGFWDQKKRRLYICPIPCFVISIQFKGGQDA